MVATEILLKETEVQALETTEEVHQQGVKDLQEEKEVLAAKDQQEEVLQMNLTVVFSKKQKDLEEVKRFSLIF